MTEEKQASFNTEAAVRSIGVWLASDDGAARTIARALPPNQRSALFLALADALPLDGAAAVVERVLACGLGLTEDAMQAGFDDGSIGARGCAQWLAASNLEDPAQRLRPFVAALSAEGRALLCALLFDVDGGRGMLDALSSAWDNLARYAQESALLTAGLRDSIRDLERIRTAQETEIADLRRVCRVCGCTVLHACTDAVLDRPCAWVPDPEGGDLCSVCARKAYGARYVVPCSDGEEGWVVYDLDNDVTLGDDAGDIVYMKREDAERVAQTGIVERLDIDRDEDGAMCTHAAASAQTGETFACGCTDSAPAEDTADYDTCDEVYDAANADCAACPERRDCSAGWAPSTTPTAPDGATEGA